MMIAALNNFVNFIYVVFLFLFGYIQAASN